MGCRVISRSNLGGSGWPEIVRFLLSLSILRHANVGCSRTLPVLRLSPGLSCYIEFTETKQEGTVNVTDAPGTTKSAVECRESATVLFARRCVSDIKHPCT